MQMRGGRAAAKKYVDTVTENNEDGGEDDADDSTDNGDDPHKERSDEDWISTPHFVWAQERQQ